MTSPFPFSVGQVLTANQLNSIGAYTAYTPTYTNVTVGNGISEFFYTQVNEMVHVYGKFVLGSTSAITGLITVQLPINCNPTYNNQLGVCSLVDAGIKSWIGFANLKDTDEVYLFAIDTAATYAGETSTSATKPFTWGTNDYFTLNVVYRAA